MTGKVFPVAEVVVLQIPIPVSALRVSNAAHVGLPPHSLSLTVRDSARGPGGAILRPHSLYSVTLTCTAVVAVSRSCGKPTTAFPLLTRSHTPTDAGGIGPERPTTPSPLLTRSHKHPRIEDPPKQLFLHPHSLYLPVPTGSKSPPTSSGSRSLHPHSLYSPVLTGPPKAPNLLNACASVCERSPHRPPKPPASP